ncbi:hypothetical protein DIPPA_16628 [Diplonema papillatum]|nr:hypothetical protein DIPPA_16628 [Diplonema papillatum]
MSADDAARRRSLCVAPELRKQILEVEAILNTPRNAAGDMTDSVMRCERYKQWRRRKSSSNSTSTKSATACSRRSASYSHMAVCFRALQAVAAADVAAAGRRATPTGSAAVQAACLEYQPTPLFPTQ